MFLIPDNQNLLGGISNAFYPPGYPAGALVVNNIAIRSPLKYFSSASDNRRLRYFKMIFAPPPEIPPPAVQVQFVL